MTLPTATALIERTLYHGTLRDHQDSIRRYGIRPSIGSFVKDAYGSDYDFDDEDFNYHHGDQEAVFAADRGEIHRSLTAITHHISKKLNKSYGAVTWKDVHNHGLLAKIEDGDEYMRRKLPHDHPDAGIEHEDGVPLAAEPGDYYSTDSQSGDKLLTGSALLRKFKRHGFKTDHHAKVVDTQRLVTPTELSRRQQKKANVASRDPQLKFMGKGFYESTATELIEARLSEGDDYKMSHTAPDEDSAPMHDLTGNGVYPKDVHISPHYYHGNDPHQSDAYWTARSVMGKPEKRLWVYRAVPKGVKTINHGDWVTPVKAYARDHGKHHSDPSQDMHVIAARTEAKNLHTDGNSLAEWGYNGDASLYARVVFRPRKRVKAD